MQVSLLCATVQILGFCGVKGVIACKSCCYSCKCFLSPLVVLVPLGVKEGAASLLAEHCCEGVCSGPKESEEDLFLSQAEQGFHGLLELILNHNGS